MWWSKVGVTIHYYAAINCGSDYIEKIIDHITNQLKRENVTDIRHSTAFDDEKEQKTAFQLINSSMVPVSIADNPLIYTPRAIVKEPIIPCQKRALYANLHSGCETFSLVFYKNCNREMWVMPYSFVKTQFAPIWVHILICNLLGQVESMIISKGGSFNVNDEGEYYYSKDIKKLETSIGYVNILINKISKSLGKSKS